MPRLDRRCCGLRLLVTVTFNANQLRSHLLPLIALDEVESISLVADAVPPSLPKVRSYVPSAQSRRTLGRAGAKRRLCLRLARSERFDWVVGFNLVPHGLNAVHVAESVGVRSMYHMIGGQHEWAGGGYAGSNSVLSRLPRPVPALERHLLRRIRSATVVATMGPRGRALVVERGVQPTRAVVIPPSTETERFRPTDGARRYAAVCVAALVGLKRVDDFLEAAAIVRRRHRDARFAVAGDGPLRLHLERRAAALGLEGHVDFLGHVGRVEDVYAATKSFALASEREALPISMLDAMAAGVPVVAADVGEIGTAVTHGESGLLFPPGDLGALANQLDRLLVDDELRNRLGATAREEALKRYSVGAVAATYRNVLTAQRYAATSSSS